MFFRNDLLVVAYVDMSGNTAVTSQCRKHCVPLAGEPRRAGDRREGEAGGRRADAHRVRLLVGAGLREHIDAGPEADGADEPESDAVPNAVLNFTARSSSSSCSKNDTLFFMGGKESAQRCSIAARMAQSTSRSTST